MYCSNCGTSVESKQSFCSTCGARLTAQNQEKSLLDAPWSQSGVNLDEANAPAPMNLVEAVIFSYKNYLRFSGRASRSEYWYWTLFNVLFFLTAYAVYFLYIFFGYLLPNDFEYFVEGYQGEFLYLFLIFLLSTIIPGLARGVRRLHDTNKSGALLFLGLIPLVGPVLLLVFFGTDSDVGPNRYGPPKK